jgi:hypothetical protein
VSRSARRRVSRRKSNTRSGGGPAPSCCRARVRSARRNRTRGRRVWSGRAALPGVRKARVHLLPARCRAARAPPASGRAMGDASGRSAVAEGDGSPSAAPRQRSPRGWCVRTYAASRRSSAWKRAGSALPAGRPLGQAHPLCFRGVRRAPPGGGAAAMPVKPQWSNYSAGRGGRTRAMRACPRAARRTPAARSRPRG